MEPRRDKVDFFIIGAQKSGTTALASFLTRHPKLQMASVKEVHHFDDERHVDWSSPDHGRLHRHFEWNADDVLRGEATPIYLYWPPALPRLRAYNPDAKLIVALRHPAFRAHSHWRMEAARGLEKLDFETAVAEAGRARVRSAPSGVHRTFSYVERGHYGGQIERLLGLFPRKQIHFFRTDRLWLDPAGVLAGIEDFLDLPNQLADIGQEYIVPVEAPGFGRISQKTFEYLTQHYITDILLTEAATGLRLSDWLAPSYAEPMPRGAEPSMSKA
ncbi:sulfotransferase domain-containing protein [Aminobacter sp. HY435]|uniref:sulfotransferase domain-containing protein n=1 Tax=Aminobacter sp. HY435 TaxID=2970917 RepID=UPI0022B94640|nr:sulfotransferase domain-containing protein [Aminobacter sp. HY435]